MNRRTDVLLIGLLIVVSAVPRFVGLGRFTSLDEPFWLRQGSNFYYALGQRQFQNTIYEYHPAVTTMWLVTAGLLVYFPEYRSLGEGYLKPGKFDLFLPAQGKDPLQLLIASRAFQVVVVILLLGIVYLLLRRLFDSLGAFLATGLISLSPFSLGHSRLLNHEAMLALFTLVSVLALLVYLYRGRKLVILFMSAIAGALAQLTKSSGIVLLAPILLMLLVWAVTAPRAQRNGQFALALKTLGVWLVVVAAAYVLFWPGMWVAPGQMLSDVYGNAFTYALEGSRLSVAGDVNASQLGLGTLIPGLQFYLTDLAWRTTPVTWLGFLIAIVVMVVDVRKRRGTELQLVALYALILALLFVLLFSIQRGPKPPHYIVTTYICVDLLAGLGTARLVQLLTLQARDSRRSELIWSVAVAFILVQAASAAAAYPYYITYYNPLLEDLQPGIQNPTLENTGYGVGLDQAAAYLAQKPDARDLTVLAANGYGSFSYYFPGHTTPINNFALSDPQVAEVLANAQYVVVDYYNQKRINLVADLAGIQPEHIVWINGIDFLRIYPASDFKAAAAAATSPGGVNRASQASTISSGRK